MAYTFEDGEIKKFKVAGWQHVVGEFSHLTHPKQKTIENFTNGNEVQEARQTMDEIRKGQEGGRSERSMEVMNTANG